MKKLIDEIGPFIDVFNGRLYMVGSRLGVPERIKWRRYLDDGQLPDNVIRNDALRKSNFKEAA